jgi:hypothetical protein
VHRAWVVHLLDEHDHLHLFGSSYGSMRTPTLRKASMAMTTL